MNALVGRGGLFEDFLKDMNPGFYVRPLHGDPLPTPGQMKVDVNVVSLRAEVRQQDQQTEGEKVLRSERYFGAVARSFQLPTDIDAAQCKAKYDNGVLTLTLPKKQGGNAQRLAIE